jgi:tryptophan halogenase
MRNKPIQRIVILGGGSAGWLTAGVIAAEYGAKPEGGVSMTLIESPGIPPIGVGEGTWPSMRATLQRMGVSETDLFRECDASFKQGAKFARWVTSDAADSYYHPLVLPIGFNEMDLVTLWQPQRDKIPFADAICFQGTLCEHGKAPKQISTPEFAAVATYAYHLDSSKLGEFLKKHCVENLGVKHVVDHVVEVKSHENGDVAGLVTQSGRCIEGDLFIDCSGLKSRLLGEHFDVPFISKKHILFNDTAIAVQAPYKGASDPIASHTISTAQSNGWIWDIGLPSRKGVGHVYSSAHTTEEKALSELRAYLALSVNGDHIESMNFRTIRFDPGHRETFWYKNCVAVGLSAGFLEPLEASALVLVEAAAAMIRDDLPADRVNMDIVSKRFNKRFTYYWDTIVDFLKLHYVLSQRTDSDYWRDNRAVESITEALQDSLRLWRRQVPNAHDFPLAQEMFPAASWQYVLYGMDFVTESRQAAAHAANRSRFEGYCRKTRELTERYLKYLPENRVLIEKIRKFGMSKA